MNTLAMFYLQMKDKMLLLASVIQKLIGEFQEVHSYSTAHHLSKLHQDLKLNVRENYIRDLIDNLSKKKDLLKRCNEGVFRTDQTHKKLYSRVNSITLSQP